MNLLLVNDLTESKLYRNTNMGRRLSGQQVSQLLYLVTLSVYALAQDSRTKKFAQQYATQASAHGNYVLFKFTGNDLFALSYHVNNPGSERFQGTRSEKHLQSLNFDSAMHVRMLRKIAQGDLSQADQHLRRLYQQLKIRNAKYDSWRRSVAEWKSIPRAQRQQVIKNMAFEIHRISVSAEVLPHLKRIADVSMLRKAATAAAGAYLGHELADKAGKHRGVGTGLGAIAGYWAGK